VEKRKKQMHVLEDFIVLEGIDGSGTTTLLKNLQQALKNKNLPFLSTCEPTDLPTGKVIRQILQGQWKVQGRTLAELFAADRREHLYQEETGIVDQCRKQPVISDRYLFSSLAYQSLETSWEDVWQLNSDFPLPQKLIFLDLPALTAQQRMQTRGEDPEIFDALSTQEKIAVNYLKCLDFFKDRDMEILKIDGTLSPEEICEKSLEFILQ